MRFRALAAAAVLVLAGGLTALPASAATVAHSHHAHRPAGGPVFDHHTCFDGPLAKNHTKPGGACWAGGICLKDGTHFIQGDGGVWCMGQRRKNQKHPAEGRVIALRNEATKDHEYFIVDLVGYVTYDPGNPIPGHAFWPFRDPNLDHAFDHYPVINIVFVPGGKVTHSIRIECINNLSIALNKPASYGPCSREVQFGHDLHNSYFVWTSPGHRLEAVHITNAEDSKAPICLFADDPAVAQPPWYVRLEHPRGPVDLVGVLQFWYERHIA